jgi:DNA-directed RNA polymerase subunit F
MTDTTAEQVDHVTDADVASAEREASEAAALVNALEERVRDGDESITVEQIEQARSLGRFARLRAEATARKVERAKQRARRQLVDQARARILDLAEGAHPTNTAEMARVFGKTRDAIRSALAELREAAETRNALISDAGNQAIAAGLAGDRDGTGPYGMRGGVMVAGLSRPVLDPVDPGRVLAAVLWEAVVAVGLPRQAAPWTELAKPAHQVAWRTVIGRDLEA